MAGTINEDGLEAMIDGIGQLATLELAAYEGEWGSGGTELDTTTALYTTAQGTNVGVSEITADITLTIPINKTVNYVYLRQVGATTSEVLAYANLTTNNVFPSGGDLIVSSFELTVA